MSGVLQVPLAPVLQTNSWSEVTRLLLVEVRRRRASSVELDLAGVIQLHAEEVNALVNLATTANLLGVEACLIGVGESLREQLLRSPFRVNTLLRSAA